MKKIIFLLTALLVLSAGSLYSNALNIMGYVYDADGSSGTALTANSFASLAAYRTGIAGEMGRQENGYNGTQQIFPAGYTPGYTAYFLSDVGSTDWSVPSPAGGQVMMAVCEVYGPQFGWGGNSYVACTQSVITTAEVNGLFKLLPDFRLVMIPAPSIEQTGANYITVSWTGMNMDYIDSYTLYRAPAASGPYSPVAVVAQNKDNPVQYTDNTGLAYGTTYYYEIAVDFVWGGGGGAPAYYTTNAMSAASGSAAVATYTASPTPTGTDTPTWTYTDTQTATDTNSPTTTFTETCACTGSFTMTMTDTPTFTCTDTPTMTGTATNTQTITATTTDSPTGTNTPVNTGTGTETGTPTMTMTFTATGTDTDTSTATPTGTATPTWTRTSTWTNTPNVTLTQTLTSTPTPPVLDLPIAYPVPASNTITFAYRLGAVSAVRIYVYNLMGTQVAVFDAGQGTAGLPPNAVSFNISKFAPGIYFYIVKAPDSGSKFSVEKFEVEK